MFLLLLYGEKLFVISKQFVEKTQIYLVYYKLCIIWI